MKVKLLKCPACSAPIKVDGGKSSFFACDYCGHSGYVKPEDVVAAPEPGQLQGLKYAVDIAMVIDATASMRHLIDAVKSNALRFYDDLRTTMQAKSKRIDHLRVRVVAFRDFYADGRRALETSEFFELPGERAAFNDFVGAIEAKGGGHLPECGLEALATAIRSSWTTLGDKRRHIIVLWTDASTHPLEKKARGKPKAYPLGMPKNLHELTDMWEDEMAMRASTKRLILFAPDKFAWTELAAHWSNTIQYPSEAGEGLNKLDYRTILDAIANSV